MLSGMTSVLLLLSWLFFRCALEGKTGDQCPDDSAIDTKCVHESDTQPEKTDPDRHLDHRHSVFIEPFHRGQLKPPKDPASEMASRPPVTIPRAKHTAPLAGGSRSRVPLYGGDADATVPS